jgi:predicted phage terminase large subunit-like protein
MFGLETAEDSRAVDKWDIKGHSGGMIASGVGGSITGYGADLFLIDDPIKNQEEAESEVYREKVWGWYRSVARTRLEPKAAIILIMVRWHRQDLAGKILAEEKDWEVVNLPAEAEENDLLGRAVGEALWPERYDKEALAKIKYDSGSRVWSSLFQGHPTDPESALVKREWIRYYDELPPACNRYGGSDTATSQKTQADNTALVDVCTDKEGWLYVDDVFCEKTSVSAFANYVNNQHQIKKYVFIKLESNNAGEAIRQRIDEVGRENKNYPPISLEKTDTDKVVRVIEFQPLIENGTIRFKRGHKKIAELIDHLCNFDGKGSDIDDDVDALGFAIKAAKKGARKMIYVIG